MMRDTAICYAFFYPLFFLLIHFEHVEVLREGVKWFILGGLGGLVTEVAFREYVFLPFLPFIYFFFFCIFFAFFFHCLGKTTRGKNDLFRCIEKGLHYLFFIYFLFTHCCCFVKTIFSGNMKTAWIKLVFMTRVMGEKLFYQGHAVYYNQFCF